MILSFYNESVGGMAWKALEKEEVWSSKSFKAGR